MTTGFLRNLRPVRQISVGCALATVVLAARADTVYDNLTTPLNFYAGGFGPYGEIADDVNLNLAGTSHIFESLSLAYTAANVPADATMTLSLYKMDGAPTTGSFGEVTPGSLLFRQTVPVVNSDSWLVTVTDPSPSIVLPDHVAVGVSFTGINYDPSSSDAGPLLLDPPTVGSSLPDFWILGLPGADPGWGLYTLGDVSANFGLRITTTPVPDSVSWWSLLSFPLLCGLHRRMQRFERLSSQKA